MREEQNLLLEEFLQFEEEERTVSSEFIHVRLEAIPPLNVIGVYTCRQKKPKKCKRSWETKYEGV